MVRIDLETEPVKAESGLNRQQIRREIKKELLWSELRGKFKKFFRKIGCCLFLLAVLGGLVLIALAALNQASWVKIPFIAEIFP